ncbi:MAG: LuxR C-terminal-related transcriptional regulator [Muribaculaceae bacterium]|nr:LuxR C-terminal-related transcriptional regulator [Muribaculaceae bacterium]
MKNIIYALVIIAALGIESCSKSTSRYDKELTDAETVMQSNADSAISILECIDLSDLKADSLRAKYIFLKAYGHMKQNRSMIADSLIEISHNYYKGKDMFRDIRSGVALAWYKFWIGDTPGAVALLDSLSQLTNVPDSLMAQTLRVRTLLGVSEYQGEEIIPLAKRLINLETDQKKQIEAKYMLVSAYEFSEKMDSALLLTNEIIDHARNNKLGELHFQMMLERAQILTELGRVNESNEDINYIFEHAGAENGAADYLHMISAMNALNSGDIVRASKEIALADSLAIVIKPDDETYYRSYSNLIHTMIDFKQTGKMMLKHVNGLNNHQRERFNRMKASQWESERGALHEQNRALELKAESQHKTVIMLIIIILALVLLGCSLWIIIVRRQRERENEERIEALLKMVDEYSSAPLRQESESSKSSALRSAMLKQLGIIKMVAETPTEQNREMLRKISAIDGDTNGELVDWQKVFEMIDNLYSGFYTKLHDRYGNLLNLKEVQIIVLMVAGFSTKEISVITGQTTSTIYVRKSSIRKKLGVPEKEDIVKFLTD